MKGQVLVTKERFLEEHRTLNVEAAIKSFQIHDLEHPATSTQQLTQLILAENGFIDFNITDKVADIGVFDYRCFEEGSNVLIHRPGQTLIYCIKWSYNCATTAGPQKCLT
jgi:hypothetical protein